jgi:hypothetical protein
VFDSLVIVDLRAKVSRHRSLKYLHHEAEQRTCQGRVPSPFGTLITDEGVLVLHFQELE